MTSASRGAFLTIAMRWVDRLLGVISTIVLARLLVPADLGIVAAAAIVIALVDVFLDLGVVVALVRNPNAQPSDFSTAWTIRVVQGCLATVVVLLTAEWAAAYFHEPRVAAVLRVLAFTFVIGAVENIGVVSFQKEMRFDKDFQFFFYKRAFGFVVTLLLAVEMRSYWALVVGTVVSKLFGVVVSYRMHDFRPKFTVEKFKDVFGISQWVLAWNVALYLEKKLHQFFVGGRESTSVMGAYSLADDIAAMPTTELLMPMNRVLFPALVKVSHERTEFKRLYLLAQSIHALIGIPAGIGLVLVAPEVVTWLLGEKWLIAIPFVQVLALLGIVNAIVSSQLYVLLTLGNVRLLALLSTSQVVLFGGLAVFLIPGAGALEISWLRLLVSLAGSALYALAILRHLDNLRLSEVLNAFVRPIVAGAIMAVCVWQFGAMIAASSFLMLLFKVALGVVIYLLVIAALWLVSGRPAGAETYVMGTIRALLSTRISSGKGDADKRAEPKP